jgi:BirA family biotin operon repressor/biotin-[acetyl-CoA-carboxylase] ligase
VHAALKWPNDILIGGGKLAGILAEQSGESIVVGIGINVLGGLADLPVATATSLELQGAGGTDRSDLLAGILGEIERWYLRWQRTGAGDAEACGLRQEYLRLSATVGSQVRVELPGGRVLRGTASGVDSGGRLLVTPGAGAEVAVSAGDVVHVRLSLVSRFGQLASGARIGAARPTFCLVSCHDVTCG